MIDENASFTFRRQTYCFNIERINVRWSDGSAYYRDVLEAHLNEHGGGVALLHIKGENGIIGLTEPTCGGVEDLFQDPRNVCRHATLNGARRLFVGARFPRSTSEPTADDLAGALRLSRALQACGIELEDVYSFGADGGASLKGWGAFADESTAQQEQPRRRWGFRRGKHAPPEAWLEGPFGEEVAAIYDVCNRSTIARAEALLSAAEALTKLGTLRASLEAANLPSQDLEKVEALGAYVATAEAEELAALHADRRAAYYLRLLERLDGAPTEPG